MRRGKQLILMIGVVLGVLALSGSVWGLEILEAGYVSETYATYSEVGVQRSPYQMVFADNGNLYVTQLKDDSIWCISPDGIASRFTSGLNDAQGIVWGGGTSYGDYLYVAANGRIVRVGLDGTKANFATRYCAGALGLDGTGNYRGHLYTTTGCQDHTYRVDTSGNVTMFTNWPGWIDGGGPHDVSFDNRGNYGGLMYVATSYVESKAYVSGLFILDTSGNATRFTEDIVVAHCVDFDQGDVFGGDMFVIGRTNFNQDDSLWRVRQNGIATEFAKIMSPVHPSMVFGPDGAMYVSEYDETSETVIISQISAGTLVGLEVTGPNEVVEDFSAQYKAIAHYDNGGTADVTGLADWWVDDETIASINAGLLTTEAINLPTDITITAEYSEGESSEAAEKQVSIFAICPSGSALEFDGVDDYVDCGNGSSLNITDEITMVAWVKPSDSSGSEFIASKWHNQAIDSSYGLRLADLNPRFFLANNTQDTTKTFTDLVIKDNVWNHIVATWDGSIMKAYLNGILSDQTELFIGPINSTTNPLAIGYNPGGNGGIGGDYLNGTIDEVSIWNRTLSAEEIRAIMHTRPEGDDPNLVGYWAFDEGEGQVARDLSVYGNDGTLGSGPGEDDSDPAWVESDAPVGICSLEGIVERNLLNILGMKNDVLDILDEAIGKEEALWEYMDIVFKDRDFGNTKKGDVVKAKQKIHSAIQEEEQAESTVGKSIEKLEDALDALDIE